MQTLSNLRRSRFNYQPLILLLLFLGALVYESIGTIYPLLSPLLGVGFYYWIQNSSHKEKQFTLFLFFGYTLFFELDREMIFFSFILLTLSYYLFFANYLKEAISCEVCLIILYILYTYLGYYLLNYFLAFLFNIALPTFDVVYFIYMISDFIVILLFL